MTIMKSVLLSLAAVALSAVSASADFAYGGDVSWMSFQEDKGIKFYQQDEATETTVEDLMKDYGFNAARLRVWVNPENYASGKDFCTGGYCDKADVIAKAKRLYAKRQDIMLCFHFSDVWCDPSKQRIPKAWEASATDLDALTALAVGHLQDVCNALKDEGITAKWVQVGNEDNTGFMKHKSEGGELPGCLTNVGSDGSQGYIKVFNALAKAAREIFPEVLIVHHLANGQDYTKLNWNLSKVYPMNGSVEENTKIDADLLGLSLYPLQGTADTSIWRSYAEGCLQAMQSVYTAYGLKSIVVEVGMNNDYSTATTGGTSQKAHTEQCNEDVSAFAEYFISEARRSGICDGVFYWEPQSSYTDYTSATGVTGQGGYTMGSMMDVERNKMTWGSRTKLVPNAYWDMVKLLSGGYDPEPEPPVEPGDWNLKYSLDDRLTWTLAPMELNAETGKYCVSGLSDERAPYCMNYFIVNKDETESYIASEGVKVNVTYSLYSTLSGPYEGWAGWLQDKWLEPKHEFEFDPTALTLLVVEQAGIDAIETDRTAEKEYFTLQGISISTPQPGSLVICRQGTKVAKVLVK